MSAAQTLSLRDRPAWRGTTEGVAHAHAKGARRTVCGVPAIGERWATPNRPRCEDCVIALGLDGAPR